MHDLLPTRPSQAGPAEVVDVMIADDHPLIIEGLAAALRGFGVKVTARASDGGAVQALYDRTMPDVVVLDLRFGDGPSGLEVAQELLGRHADARIVIYSQFDQDGMIRQAYQTGVMAFITKDTGAEILADAIHTAKRGQTYMLPAIAERLAFLSMRADDSPAGKLAPRELAVFKMMAEGLTNAEIGEALTLSTKTISLISQGIKEQLGVHRPADITLLAVRHGLIDSPASELDARELEVFKLMAEGRTNVEIADALGLSPKTISTTSQSIKERLGLNRAADITLLAVRCGLISA